MVSNAYISFHRTTTVEVMLMNVNDMIPQFTQPVYELRVAENQPIGTVIGQVMAIDGDGDEIVYGFAGANPGMGVFSINCHILLTLVNITSADGLATL